MPTETTAPRLIDANALKEKIEREMKVCHELFELGDKESFKKYHGLKRSLELLDSAPTVETTDDVLARLPLGVKVFKYDNGDGTFRIKATAHDCEKKYLNPWAYGETTIEAVLRLEASLNPK